MSESARRWIRVSLAVIPVVIAMGALSGHARADPDWSFVKDGQSLPRDKGLDGKIKKKGPEVAADVSGLACAPTVKGPRLCLVVDDETQGAQIVRIGEGVIDVGDALPLIDKTLGDKGKRIELDAEAVAFGEDAKGGAFYVIGSHGRARNPGEEAEDQAKAEADKHAFRLPLSDLPGEAAALAQWGDKRPSGLLTAFLLQLDADRDGPPPTRWPANARRLKDSFDQPLTDNGMTLEGLAVASGQMFVGFRGPVLTLLEAPAGKATVERAVVLELPAAAVFDGHPGRAKLHVLALGRDTTGKARGVRDIAPHRGGFLLLAGPVNDPLPKGTPPVCGDYAIYEWDGVSEAPTLRRHLKAYVDEVRAYLGEAYDPEHPPKPEGLTPLDAKGTLMLTFDGPPNGYPKRISLDQDAACPTTP